MFFLPSSRSPSTNTRRAKASRGGPEGWSLNPRSAPARRPPLAGGLAPMLHCVLPAAHPVTHGAGTPGTPGLVLGPAASGFPIWKLLSRLRSNQPCLLPGPQPAGEGEQGSLGTSALPLCAAAYGP